MSSFRTRFLVFSFFISAVLFISPALQAKPKRPSKDRSVLKYASALYDLAKIYEKSGQLDKACKTLSKVIFYNPTDSKAGKLREKISLEYNKNGNPEKESS